MAFALAGIAGCAADGVMVEPGNQLPRQVKVPPGHLPPPGKCRIWYLNKPPGQQPPPGECEVLRYRVPLDAALIRG